MALSSNTPIVHELGDYNSIPVIDNDIVYEGAMVGMVAGSGHGNPINLSGDGTDVFMGHSRYEVDNTLVDHAAAGKNIRLLCGRYRLKVTLTGVAITDVGATVYASDDNTLTKSSSNAVVVGVITRYVTTHTCIVEFRTTP